MAKFINCEVVNVEGEWYWRVNYELGSMEPAADLEGPYVTASAAISGLLESVQACPIPMEV